MSVTFCLYIKGGRGKFFLPQTKADEGRTEPLSCPAGRTLSRPVGDRVFARPESVGQMIPESFRPFLSDVVERSGRQKRILDGVRRYA
jgi:hypothetical protein